MGARLVRCLKKPKGGEEAVKRIIPMICLLMLFGCSAQREIRHESSGGIGVLDTSSIDMNAGRMSGKWAGLYAFCDSLHIRLWADSAVTPGGSVIHNPNIDLSAQRPVVSCEIGEISAEEDSVHEESGLVLSGVRTDSRDLQQETKAAEGFSLGRWIGLILMFVLTFLLFRYGCIKKS